MKKASVLGVSIFAVILLLLTTAGSAFGESPSPRGYHQMAYDSESGIGHPVWWSNRSIGLIRLIGTTKHGPSTPNQKNGCKCPQAPVQVDLVAEIWPTTSESDRIILSVITDDLSTLQTWAYDANQ